MHVHLVEGPRSCRDTQALKGLLSTYCVNPEGPATCVHVAPQELPSTKTWSIGPRAAMFQAVQKNRTQPISQPNSMTSTLTSTCSNAPAAVQYQISTQSCTQVDTTRFSREAKTDSHRRTAQIYTNPLCPEGERVRTSDQRSEHTRHSTYMTTIPFAPRLQATCKHRCLGTVTSHDSTYGLRLLPRRKSVRRSVAWLHQALSVGRVTSRPRRALRGRLTCVPENR